MKFFRSEYDTAREILACAMAGMGCWFSYVVFMRLLLRSLLTYQGFLFEGRGKQVSAKTKLWGILLKRKKFKKSKFE